MTTAKLRLAMAAMGPGTKVAGLCAELGISRQTLYRHVDPKGSCDPTARSSCSVENTPLWNQVCK